jgi:hypothetical protein
VTSAAIKSPAKQGDSATLTPEQCRKLAYKVLAKMLVEKKSQAIKVWCAVVLAVLTLMYFQTRNYRVPDYNLLIQGNADVVGGRVFIDGRERGVLAAADHADVGGAQFRDKLSPGRHLIEVRKSGFKPFKQTVSMRLEAFLPVDLLPEDH